MKKAVYASLVLFLFISALFGGIEPAPALDFNFDLHTVKMPPAAPTGLAAEMSLGPPPNNYVCLRWDSTGTKSYTITRKGGGDTKTFNINTSYSSYEDHDIGTGSTYTYTIKANFPDGPSLESSPVTITPLSPPTNLKLLYNSGTGDKGLELRWTPSSSSVTGYQVDRYCEDNHITDTHTVSASTTSFVDIFNPDSKYYYRVKSIGPNNGSSCYSNSILWYSPPVEPPNFKAEALSAWKVKLTWTDYATHESRYKLWRNDGKYLTPFDLPANSSSFTDDGLWPDINYSYKLEVWTPSDTFEESRWVYINLLQAPSNLQASVVSKTEVRLTWKDNSSTESYFTLQRKKSGDTNWADVSGTGKDGTSFNDSGLTPDTTYVYRVRAHCDTSDSAYSNEVSVTPTASNLVITPGNLLDLNNLKPLKPQLTLLQIGSPSMTVDGVVREIDPGKGTAPVIIEGRTLLPVRAVIESQGGSVEWDGTEKKVTVRLGDKEIELWIDSTRTRVNGTEKTTDVAPRIINERTMLPVRFISENLGLKVDWDAATSQVTIKPGG